MVREEDGLRSQVVLIAESFIQKTSHWEIKMLLRQKGICYTKVVFITDLTEYRSNKDVVQVCLVIDPNFLEIPHYTCVQ